MKSKNLLIKTGLILLFVTSFISCNQDDELIEINNNIKGEVKLEFKTFEKENNLDINVIATTNLKDATYTWTVDGKEYPGTSSDGKILHWGPSVGDTKFCVTVKNKENPKGIKVCKTFTRTQKEVDDANATTKDEVKLEFKTFEKDRNLDIEVVTISNLKDATYTWTVDGKEYPATSSDGKVLNWGPSVGDTKFCVTVKNKENPKGIKVCKTFTRTQKEVDDANATTKDEVKLEFKTFEKENNLDINVIATTDLKDATYTWTVDGKEYPATSSDGKVLNWGPSVGDTKFCLTVTNKENPKGIKVCKTFTRTQKEVDDVNS